MLVLANSNHVVMRAMESFAKIVTRDGDATRADWANAAVAQESRRITNAFSCLYGICEELRSAGLNVIVIKSLDHWPDLGSDLDLYTDAEPQSVVNLMKAKFRARTAPRSWGDRLANKWNFIVPGLPELVEIHMGRLGQTGEQAAIAGSLLARSRPLRIGGRIFHVPAPEDRFMISTLQRMYRHFYIRLCDIVDNAALIGSGAIDFEDLRSSAKASGLWEGVATYLCIISDYVAYYRGRGLDLPPVVRSSASFDGAKVRFGRGFLRIPILPEAASLYASQLSTLLLSGEIRNSARLSLLPCLATAAALGQKITGSDKGIW
jgi:hypothetical protein